ncbi:MAG: DNA/RNA helicase domain-containing protein, partial [Ruminiclostridium sp.]
GFEFDYDFKIVNSPNYLRELIVEKNNINNKARLLSGYCWNWISEGKTDKTKYDISIKEHNFNMSWNLSNTTWAIDKDSIDQVGCIHTSQGLEFDYVGVIIGNDMRYDQEKIITDFTKRAKSDKSINGLKKRYKENKEAAVKLADQIIKNTYRTLMTRGQKGCYVYCIDEKLQEYLKDRLKRFYKPIEYSYTTQTINDKIKAAQYDHEYE